MSLRVWLPLNGNLDNQGLDQVTVTNNGAVVDNNGKIGKCYSFGASSYLKVPLPKLSEYSTTAFSMCLWVKVPSPTSGNKQLLHIGKGSGWVNNRFTILYMGSTTVSQIVTSISDGSSYGAYNCRTDIPIDTWVHIASVFDNKKLKLYINGELKNTYNTTYDLSFSSIEALGVGGAPNGAELLKSGYINDVRIYDHALSPLEVKQISQGLVLHYPLNRNGWGQENLSDFSSIISNWIMEGLTGSNYQDDNYGNIIKLVSSSTNKRMYHYVTNVWESGQIYAVSFLAKADTNDVTCDMSRSIVDFTSSFSLTTKWKKYQGIITSTATTSGGTLSFRIHQSGKVVYITKIKLEKGPIATPWCPNSSDTLATSLGLNDNVEYDTSGYGNNGTRTGTFSWTSDTPKYNISTYMPKESLITHPCPVFSGINQEWTCAMWVKLNITNQSQILMNNFNAGNSIVHQANSYPLLYLNGGSDDYYMYGSQIVNAEEWTHVVFVFKNSEGLRNIYINGELTNNYGPNKTSTPRGIPDTVIIGTNLKGYISDYRIYCTALSAQDVKSLYNNSAYIDNQGNLYGAILREV